ncbi:hypothetical protein [Pontimicrobium sp. IMCC45349]|uniref:hypothetical protein n=1 Tax=Pontimicrobium sp. IMCC45349 TaxID=3391574 RepID=UPI00399FC9A5
MKKTIFFLVAISSLSVYSQRILSEKVNFFDINLPQKPLAENVKTYKVIVETPYTLTAADVEQQSLIDFEQEKANYAQVVEQSKVDFEQQLKDHDEAVAQAKEKYEIEMKDFKELTLLERLALTDQGKKPQLKTPSKPVYRKPSEPIYRKPNLNDYLIFDNQSLSDNITLHGYDKGGEDVLFLVNFSKMNFQDNGGQTFYSQPTKLQVIENGAPIDEKTFHDESKFLTSSTSNTIDLNRYEKKNVMKLIKEIEAYINEQYGYKPVAASIEIGHPKNKKREYDQLEKAKIVAVSAFKKLTQNANVDVLKRVKGELEKAKGIWKAELTKVNYSDKKALYNKDIATMIYFNLLKVDIILKDKDAAHATLDEVQNVKIDLDLNYTNENILNKLENQVYNMK